jgi:bacterial/archaeal transporter family protein
MSWFGYSLLAAFFLSSSIVLDKFLLTRHFHKLSEVTLTTAAALSGVPLLFIYFVIVPQLPSKAIFLSGFAAGMLILAGYQVYYQALKNNDAALVTTLFQLILPFNLMFGILFFNESPTGWQYVGILLVICAATVISLEERESKWIIGKKVLLQMATASMLVSLSDIVFKKASESAPFLTLAVAEYSSSVVLGVVLFFAFKKVRRELFSIGRNIFSTSRLLTLNEVFTLGGTLSIRYALVIGPLALVQGVMATQPFIVMVIVAFLSLFGLKLHHKKQKLTAVHFTLRAASIVTVIAGSVLISGYLK